MRKIIIELGAIEEHHAGARYSEAYEALARLCRDDRDCEAFHAAATDIVSQYRDLENDAADLTWELGRRVSRQRAIGRAFRTLIGRMKRHFDPGPSPGAGHREQLIHMEAHHDMLRESREAVAREIPGCRDPEKRQTLERIGARLEGMIRDVMHVIADLRALEDE